MINMKKDVKTIQSLITKWVVYKDKESLERLKQIDKELSEEFDTLMNKNLRSFKKLNSIGKRLELIYSYKFDR